MNTLPMHEDEESATKRLPHPLLSPTLHLLSSTRDITVAFCPELPHLHAYLSALLSRHQGPSKDPSTTLHPPTQAQNTSSSEPCKQPMLAILNPIALHKSTSAFSAQGLSKFFAAAVDTAYHLNRHLLIAECSSAVRSKRTDHHASDVEDETYPIHRGPEIGDGQDDGETRQSSASPWDEEVSILNVTTKSFGVGDRGWVGRTVSLRRMAERWCVFRKIDVKDDR